MQTCCITFFFFFLFNIHSLLDKKNNVTELYYSVIIQKIHMDLHSDIVHNNKLNN